MPENIQIFLLMVLPIALWCVRPKGDFSRTANAKEKSRIIERCEGNPSIIEYVALLETFGKEVICEVKLKENEPVRVGSGVAATDSWLYLKSLQANSDLPEYLSLNKKDA
ncbi:hypothetical protein OH460_07645 [Vibrio sp. Makdt]|uniref:hypothetical protein n=1 Tax=Vibrio sp. Makdt TaxID=2998828 RepID=UPI0022CD6DEA|nr:hypothetical protein [Vibrio sp. Makdt]MDA0152169.1 hypothetical protein [Vibrio sp. Makdt]